MRPPRTLTNKPDVFVLFREKNTLLGDAQAVNRLRRLGYCT
jgi:hypothetical protein